MFCCLPVVLSSFFRHEICSEAVWNFKIGSLAMPTKATRFAYVLRLSGTLPPLSASFVMTCLCSQTFISADPSRAPV